MTEGRAGGYIIVLEKCRLGLRKWFKVSVDNALTVLCLVLHLRTLWRRGEQSRRAEKRNPVIHHTHTCIESEREKVGIGQLLLQVCAVPQRMGHSLYQTNHRIHMAGLYATTEMIFAYASSLLLSPIVYCPHFS